MMDIDSWFRAVANNTGAIHENKQRAVDPIIINAFQLSCSSYKKEYKSVKVYCGAYISSRNRSPERLRR